MEDYKTIGSVVKITGMTARKIKLLREEKIVVPNKFKYQGTRKIYLYDNSEIFKIQQFRLYEELGYSLEEIKNILNKDKNLNRVTLLDNHIKDLRAKKAHIENVICAAEHMRLINALVLVEHEKDNGVAVEDIDDICMEEFDGGVDVFVEDIFSPETEQEVEEGLTEFANRINELNLKQNSKIINDLYKAFIELTKLLNSNIEESKKQEVFKNIVNNLKLLFNQNNQSDKLTSPLFYLYVYRIMGTIGLDRFLELLIGKKNAFIKIEELIENYIKNEEEN